MRTVRVKISSEAAGTIALTPVVVQEIAFPALIDRIVAVTGKHPERVCEVLKRGSIVSGTSRFRWDRLDFPESEILAELSRLPDPEPHRPFNPASCVQIIVPCRAGSVTISIEAATKRRMFRRASFRDALREEVINPEYVRYSYADRADVYRCRVDPARFAAVIDLLAYPALRARLRAIPIESIDLYCRR